MIRKNKDGTYSVRVGRGGRRHTVERWSDAEELEAQLKRARRRAAAGMEEDKGPITYQALCDLWKANHAPSDWRLRMLKHSEERWGKALVRTIAPEEVGAWLHRLDKAPKTKTHILESMRQVCRAGVDWGYLTKSPVRPRAFKAPGQERVDEIRPFETWAEVERVAEGLPHGELVRFVCATGLRCPGEVFSLTPADFDLKERIVRVNGTKTSNAQRTVPLSLNALAALDELAWPLDKHTPLWSFDYIHWRRYHWTPALKLLGLAHRSPYQMRHTFATLALEAGAPVEDVSAVMGHSDISITLTYYRKWTRPMMDRLVGFLDQIGKEQETCTKSETS